jgi:hypothetical protein
MFKGLIYKLHIHGTDALFITTYIFRIQFLISSALFVWLCPSLIEWYTPLLRSLRDCIKVLRSVSFNEQLHWVLMD